VTHLHKARSPVRTKAQRGGASFPQRAWAIEDTGRRGHETTCLPARSCCRHAHALVGGHRRATPGEGDRPPVRGPADGHHRRRRPRRHRAARPLYPRRHQIDLSAEHAATLRDDLATWVTPARRTSSVSIPRSQQRSRVRCELPRPRVPGRRAIAKSRLDTPDTAIDNGRRPT
jgi:hypothetical protein